MEKRNLAEIEQYFKDRNIPAYRFKQFNKAIYQTLATSFDEITEFPKDLREELKENFNFTTLTIAKEIVGTDSSKTAFKTIDGLVIETVLIRAKNRITICVSCQVGCPAKCAFCATGQLGFKRNLTSDEIVEQFLHFARSLKKSDKKISNIVFMGMGEPMLNYDNVLKSIEIFTNPDMIGLGKRNITVSTVGIIASLSKLLESKNQFRIAISLHAPNQEIREQIIPIAKQNRFDDLLAVTTSYAKTSNKRVTYEYILIKNLNDSYENAVELANKFKGINHLTFINLIMYNPVTHATFERTSNNNAYRFLDVLKSYGIPAFIRFSEGQEIEGACGQLAGGID
jgi:23S rRNA (adenine2503-C2)-methyltransferase